LEIRIEISAIGHNNSKLRLAISLLNEADGEVIAAEYTMDQFQWDVERDPSLFEPNIPPDYEPMQ